MAVLVCLLCVLVGVVSGLMGRQLHNGCYRYPAVVVWGLSLSTVLYVGAGIAGFARLTL